jgi:hypothetical protein
VDPNGRKPKSVTTAITLQVINFSDHSIPRPGVDVSICGVSSCTPPVAMGPADAMGKVTLQVPAGFAGYAQITSQDTYPWLWGWGFPVSESSLDLTRNALGFWSPTPQTPTELSNNRDITNVPQDARSMMRGDVLVAVHDCFGGGAPGVEVRIDSSDPAIVQRGSPTVEGATNVIFANVPPGYVHVTATPQVLGGPSGKAPVNVRAGYVTVLHMYPILYPF